MTTETEVGVPEAVRHAFDSTPTPSLVVHVPAVLRQHEVLKDNLPGVDIHYAVKALPEAKVVRALAGVGAKFDVASANEFSMALAMGAAARDCVVGAPAASREFISVAGRLGAGVAVVDSPQQLLKVMESAPELPVAVRIASSDAQHSGWPLGRKFGAELRDAVALLLDAANAGMFPVGVTVHPGSQQTNLAAWRHAIMDAGWVIKECEREGLELRWVDLGGGFPVAYAHDVPHVRHIARVIQATAAGYLPENVRLAIEPGRFLVAPAGYLRTRVELVATRGDERWVYTDAGVFHGFAESASPDITLPVANVESVREVSRVMVPVVLAGATCDSADIVYDVNRADRLQLPLNLKEGDYLTFGMAGAYTSAYTTRFNGLQPVTTVCVDESDA